MEQKSVRVNFSDNQKKKLKSAFKKKTPVSIQFSIDQLNNGKDEIFLTNRQYNKLEKHMKNNTGIRLEFSYNQLRNIKDGGLLKEILDVAEYIPVVNQLTPKVRKGAKYVKENISPKLRGFIDWLDNELSNIQGSGLDEKTLKYVKKNLQTKFNH